VVIADNLAPRVDEIFQGFLNYPGSMLFVGVVFYAVQIYADFSGYSNIAIGTGKLFGFTIMQNFNYPYFSRDIAEFWKKWLHFFLTTWFRDYVFLPLSCSISWRISKERGFLFKTGYVYLCCGKPDLVS
jgi:D-alanyl-lipoteichoic acid acyltransferase DltB (MBOAT superfamily)